MILHARRMAAALTLVATACLGAPASAQVYYNGWNTGPDYGAALNQLQQQDQLLQQQMQQMTANVVQQTMANPDCAAKYRQYQGYGGRMPYETFAYYYAATRGFTADGIAFFNQMERQNSAAEIAALQRLRDAERERQQAQGQYMQNFQANNAEFGNLLMGNSTYTNPQTGTQHVLQHVQPYTPSVDPNTGQVFQMDNLGNYYVLMPSGYWYQMVPRR